MSKRIFLIPYLVMHPLKAKASFNMILMASKVD